MPPSRIVNGLDLLFLKICASRFPTLRIAFRELGKQGQPPEAFQHDHLGQSNPISTAIEILGALNAIFSRSTQIDPAELTDHWDLLSPWFKFFFEDFILLEDPPFTPEGTQMLDHVLAILPGIFTPLRRLSLTANIWLSLGQRSPFLAVYIPQVFLKTMEEAHPSWKSWTTLASSVDPLLQRRYVLDYQPKRVLYEIDDSNMNLGRIFVRHLNIAIARMAEAPTNRELISLQGLLELVGKSTEDSPSTEKFKETPEDAIPVLIRLIRALVTYARQTSRRDQPADPDTMFLLYKVVTLTLQVLVKVLRGPRSITLALNVGIAKAIFKIPHYLFLREALEGNEENRLTHWGTLILDRISRFLVLTPVLHGFCSAIRKVSAAGDLEATMKDKSEKLWACWTRNKEKAAMLRSMRRQLRTLPSLSSCASHSQCPLRPKGTGTTNTQNRRADIRYLRCSSCESVVYCSRACQSAHWKEHRQLCQRLSLVRRKFLDPDIPLPHYDDALLKGLIPRFFERNSDSIKREVTRYAFALTEGLSSSRGQRSVDLRHKNPIVCINLSISDPLTVENCVRVINSTTAEAYARTISISQSPRQWVDQYIRSGDVENRNPAAPQVRLLGLLPENLRQTRTIEFPL
ncbi:hypothetical protein AAF712_011534 [Marasmius tenuissimus]|uniref:MYND-type domain-containing protein n=1 Tax=Marasmius tenuissimus TaxID=585030 RepID=A0ABR2ZMI6_9AGAR